MQSTIQRAKVLERLERNVGMTVFRSAEAVEVLHERATDWKVHHLVDEDLLEKSDLFTPFLTEVRGSTSITIAGRSNDNGGLVETKSVRELCEGTRIANLAVSIGTVAGSHVTYSILGGPMLERPPRLVRIARSENESAEKSYGSSRRMIEHTIYSGSVGCHFIDRSGNLYSQ
jgi:hypothetical protein